MYDKGGVLGGATVLTLPFTGVNLLWIMLAGFTLVAAGIALLRILPSWHMR